MLVLIEAPKAEGVEEGDLGDGQSLVVLGSEITDSLYCRHGVEVATATEGVASPFRGPLCFLGLDGLFEGAAVVTLPVEHTTCQPVHYTICFLIPTRPGNLYL
jgi:hypothetical protein